MTHEDKARLADYFDAHELVELLQLDTSDVIEAFESDVEEVFDDLLDIMGVRKDED